MRNASLYKNLYDLGKRFRFQENHLETIADLIELIRYHIENLSSHEVRCLMEIPVSVLKSDVMIRDLQDWQWKNSEYFSSNMSLEDERINALRVRFKSGDFTLQEIQAIAERIQDDYETLVKVHGRLLEYMLRNVEMTIRNDVSVTNYNAFIQKGTGFAQVIDRVVND